MVEYDYIAKRLRECRKNKGLTINDVGDAIGRSGKTISAWETGANQPNSDMFIALCRLYGVSISYFFPPDVTEPESLTSDEMELVTLYRRCDDDGKDAMIASARGIAAAYDAKNYQLGTLQEEDGAA